MDTAKLAQVMLSVCGISVGQLLLKFAAINLHNPKAIGVWIGGVCLNIYLVAGIALLGASTMLWIWVLRTLPLNIAYPFMAMAFVIVPGLGYVLLGEPLGWRNLVGGALIVAGVILVAA